MSGLALTELGQAQARSLAQNVASGWSPSAIYCSPLQRCVATGTAIADACGIELKPLSELNDLDYGEWQSRTYEEARADAAELLANWFAAPQLVRFPGGEALQDVAARAAGAFRLMLKRHTAKTVVLVGHDRVNRFVLTQLLDMPLSFYWRFAQGPCCVNVIGTDNYNDSMTPNIWNRCKTHRSVRVPLPPPNGSPAIGGRTLEPSPALRAFMKKTSIISSLRGDFGSFDI